jgi:hypothetical protein
MPLFFVEKTCSLKLMMPSIQGSPAKKLFDKLLWVLYKKAVILLIRNLLPENLYNRRKYRRIKVTSAAFICCSPEHWIYLLRNHKTD